MTMRRTTNFEPGDVVLVRFPFTDLTSTKQRPAVVLSRRSTALTRDRVLLGITSQKQSGSQGQIVDWRVAGLLKESWLKASIATLADELITRRLGSISARDRVEVQRILRTLKTGSFLFALE